MEASDGGAGEVEDFGDFVFGEAGFAADGDGDGEEFVEDVIPLVFDFGDLFADGVEFVEDGDAGLRFLQRTVSGHADQSTPNCAVRVTCRATGGS